MESVRRYRFPILIAACVIAAGFLLYHVNSSINTQQTQGAIAQRSVYRDAQVNAADVKATPGSAPVASAVLLQSKEFKALAKNPAFQQVLSNSSFGLLATNHQFLTLLCNPQFAAAVNDNAFLIAFNNGAIGQAMNNIISGNQPPASITQAIVSPRDPQAVVNLATNTNFQAMFANQANLQALTSLLNLGSFAGLVRDSQFQGLATQSEFQSALAGGSAASLSQSLSQLQ